MTGRIHSVETFGTVDGPGIRYVIFMQGCNFRCKYCHNPDTWDCSKGEELSVDTLVEDILKYRRYIEGVTVSGGEPLLQIDFVSLLFKRLKELKFNTCLDTSGAVFNFNNKPLMKKIDDLLSVCDLVLLDIKHISEKEHVNLTGETNKNVLEFAKYLSSINKKTWLRYVLVPTINDDETSLREWRKFADSLNNIDKVEILPYHTLALNKYKELGIEYQLKNIKEPTKEQIKIAEEILRVKKEG